MLVNLKYKRLYLTKFTMADTRVIIDHCESVSEKDANEKTLTVSYTHHNASVIDKLPDVTWLCERPEQPRAKTLSTDLVAGYKFETEPMDHQRPVFDETKDLPVYGALWDMGLGKSWLVINTACYLYLGRQIDRILVIAPSGVHEQWVNEQFPEHACVRFAAIAYSAERSQINPPRGAGLLVWAVNVETFSYARNIEPIRNWLKAGSSMIALDESHNIKSPDSARTKNIDGLKTLSKYRRICSGTPITKGTEDLFAQYRFLDQNIIGCTTFAGFKAQFCRLGGYNMKEVVGYQNIDKLRALIAPYTSRLRKADCLNLPEKIYMRRIVKMSSEQLHWYKLFKTALQGDSLANKELKLKNVMEQLVRMRQIIGGHVYDRETDSMVELPCPRVDEVVDTVSQIAGRVLLWACHSLEIRRLYDALTKAGRYCVMYYGETSGDDRLAAIAAYRSRPDCVFISNPAAGGTGLNLDGAGHVVYYTHSFNAHQRWQSEDRNHRVTTKQSVIYIDMIAEKTVDMKILSNLARKKSVSDMTFEELKSFVATLDDFDTLDDSPLTR